MSARVERLTWQDILLEAIDLPKAKLQLTLGLGSGLSAARGRIFAITDRGPNLFVSQAVNDYGLTDLARLQGIRDAKVMPTPEVGAEIVELVLEGAALRPVRRIPLRVASGRRLGGAAPAGSEMEQVFDLAGRPLPPDPLGADTEAIAVLPDGGFFLAEEYGPSLLKVTADGLVSERWVATGNQARMQHAELIVRNVLPVTIARRRLNRGLEALCASADGRWLYLGLQSAPAGEDDARRIR